jgi:hypothetical protein
MNAEQIARVAHEVNRAYCQALGDNSQPAWEDAPQWQRESALLGVQLHIENPDASPQASHESWMAQKVAEGWKYGPEKRPDLKEHHCMVPFDALPREQQAKDYIFRAVVHALAHALEGFENDAMRWRWLVRHASLGFDSAPSWNAVVRLPVFDHEDQTITALVDRARAVVGDV